MYILLHIWKMNYLAENKNALTLKNIPFKENKLGVYGTQHRIKNAHNTMSFIKRICIRQGTKLQNKTNKTYVCM